MKISEIIRTTGKCLSFEFFPPKTPTGEDRLLQRVERLKAFSPSFISVTQHAGANTLDKTRHIVQRLHGESGLTVMPHITCADPRRRELEPVINFYKSLGTENVLALRGDPEEYGADTFDGEVHFRYASDLVRFLSGYRDFCIGVAVYPEGHIDSPNLGMDTDFTKRKVDQGAEFGISQMFFENYYYYKMMDRFAQGHVTIPVIAGIMPITDFQKVEHFSELSGVELPVPLVTHFEEIDDPGDVMKAGIDFATEQCLDLLDNGVRLFHFYTLNRDEAVARILDNISANF